MLKECIVCFVTRRVKQVTPTELLLYLDNFPLESRYVVVFVLKTKLTDRKSVV